MHFYGEQITFFSYIGWYEILRHPFTLDSNTKHHLFKRPINWIKQVTQMYPHKGADGS